LIDVSPLWPYKAPPVVFTPGVGDVVLSEWASENVETIERQLLDSGAILFRGFKINNASDFERVARAVSSDLFSENGEHPREIVSGNVYTPIAYAADKLLLWHNENSFNHQWPGKIWFCCLKAAQEGGETLLADSRQVFRRLDPAIRELFRQKKIMYVRNYGVGVGLEWQTVFRTQDKAEVERRCKATGMEFEWRRDGALRTTCVRQAVINHPKTGEAVWFNQAQHWHLSCLDQDTRDSLLAICEEGGLPRDCYYGDGTPIEDSVMAEILGVYGALSSPIPWEPGDVALLDNMLTAHGRNPYVGERKLLVAMGEMISNGGVR
jgi:alpha-ketoglutarate-dependent taurine dioxygenase